MKHALNSINEKGEDYTIAYGYYLKQGLMKKRIYNYAVALSNDQQKLFIIEIDSDGNVGEHKLFHTSDIVNAKINLQGVSVIKSNTSEIKLTIPPYTSSNAEATYQLPIVQEEEARVLREYISNL